MICKWCGAAITAGGKKCARCGREIPAMSDCGGFYDLVPNPAGVAAPVVVPAAPVAPPSPSPEELARRAAAKKKAEQMALIRLGIFGLVALVIVVMLIVVMVRISEIEKRLDAVEKDAAYLDDKLSVHLEDGKTPEEPDEDLDEPEATNPTQPTTQPTQPSIPEEVPQDPEPEPDALESWSFQVNELNGNGRGFVSGMEDPSAIELTLSRNLEWTEDGVCFMDMSAEENPGQIVVIPAEQEGVFFLVIRFTGGLVQNYKEFCDVFENDAGELETVIAELTTDVEGVTVKACQLTKAEDGAIYIVEVTEEIYRFFAGEKEDTEMACAFKLEKANKNQTIYVTFQPDVPENDDTPEISDPNEEPANPGIGEGSDPVEDTAAI